MRWPWSKPEPSICYQNIGHPWVCMSMGEADADTDEFYRRAGYVVVGPGHYHATYDMSVPARG